MLTALPMDRQHHVTHRIVDMRHAASGEKEKSLDECGAREDDTLA
ncbi:hypothetical protein [Rhizobium laguerreae]|nr:hypothetical protein [Rhizobium laguerreae]